ncbi:MAG TPA: carbamoylphosphate synthase large subunit short form, partial [Bacteroidia bacterium]|nr:carbamoylphosphate synthase large subunit short form [Bacteroidia bacterium]
SVNTITTTEHNNDVKLIAKAINDKLKFSGAWFFQLKENLEGKLTLLEVASRMGGSSAAYRIKGINFALLSVFTQMQIPVEILENNYSVELDRALSNSYHIPITYNEVYVDLDDCLIIDNQINKLLISFLYQCINNKIKIVLLTKHEADLTQTLIKHRINQLFDQIIHIKKTDEKSNYIKTKDAIFIDDSHAERKKVSSICKIPVFSPDMIEGLLDS